MRVIGIDLEPDTQSRATYAIKEFAKDKQIILLTRHPAYSDQLFRK